MAIDPATGDILAIVGGRDFRLSHFNRAAGAAGSRARPSSPPLRGGAGARLLAGVRPHGPRARAAAGPGGVVAAQRRADAPEELTLREALLESNNQAAACCSSRSDRGRCCGSRRTPGLRDLPDVPSLSLGTGLVTPLELTAAFAIFPNGGVRRAAARHRARPRRRRRPALRNPVRAERVISPQTAFQMVSMLRDVIDRGTGSAARRQGVRFAAGGKTGTTNEFKDAWFVGFLDAIVVGVWVGFDQPSRSAATATARGSAADLERLHAPRGAAARAAGVRGAGRPARGAALPRCPT